MGGKNKLAVARSYARATLQIPQVPTARNQGGCIEWLAKPKGSTHLWDLKRQLTHRAGPRARLCRPEVSQCDAGRGGSAGRGGAHHQAAQRNHGSLAGQRRQVGSHVAVRAICQLSHL